MLCLILALSGVLSIATEKDFKSVSMTVFRIPSQVSALDGIGARGGNCQQYLRERALAQYMGGEGTMSCEGQK